MFTSKEKLFAQLKANFGKIKQSAFDFDKIGRFFQLSGKDEFHQVVSDRTFRDLDMNEVFMFIDRTTSKVGQQYLYKVLRTIPRENSRVEKFEKIVDIFRNNSKIKDDLLVEISSLNKNEAYFISSLFLEKHLQRPKWFWVIPVLSLTSLLTIILSLAFPKVFILFILVMAVNFGLHYWNKINFYQYSGSIPQLLRLNQVAKFIAEIDSLKVLYPNIGNSIKSLDSLGPQMSLFKLEIKLQSEIGVVVEYFVELLKAIFLVEPLVLYNVLSELDLKRAETCNVFDFVGEIDAALSIDFLRHDLPYFCYPNIIKNAKQIIAGDIYHPLIYQFVSNSINLSRKSALLTGSNMSGKTTFIRTIGINSITAQTLNTCFSKQFDISISKVHSAIRISDDLLNDKSYYFEEVLAIKELLGESNSGEQNLFLLDEIFKGTNTVERIASGCAVLKYLNKGDNIVFVATHDLELAELLTDSFALFHFAEVVREGSVIFDYKIKSGNLNNTNAIRILELNEYPKEVIEEAMRLANQVYEYKNK